MKHLIVAFALVAAISYTNSSWAAEDPFDINGAYVKENCRDFQRNERLEFAKLGFCLGFVQGVMDLLQTLMALRAQDPTLNIQKFCVPTNVSRGQLMAVMHNYAVNNPQTWNVQARNFVLQAWDQAWPCPK